MEGISRHLLDGEQWVGDSVGPFFGFMGAAAALVFACESYSPSPDAHPVRAFDQTAFSLQELSSY